MLKCFFVLAGPVIDLVLPIFSKPYRKIYLDNYIGKYSLIGKGISGVRSREKGHVEESAVRVRFNDIVNRFIFIITHHKIFSAGHVDG